MKWNFMKFSPYCRLLFSYDLWLLKTLIDCFNCFYARAFIRSFTCIFNLVQMRSVSVVNEYVRMYAGLSCSLSFFRATVEAKLLYAAPAWSGFSTAADRSRINSFLRRCLKLSYRDSESPDVLIVCSQIQMNNFSTELSTIVDTYYSNIYQTVLIWTTVFAADITTRHL